ncbi:MAG: RNA polymerase sigma factor RpoD, partial [Leptospiraceae bacterium]|nr:RNA polymerase sigma factor RpoD [Leptospiraceae bacterium]
MENLQSLPEVQRIISIGKANGEISYDEINDILPDKILNSERIDDLFTLLHEIGIEVVEEYTKKFDEPLSPKEEKPPRKKRDNLALGSSSEDPIRLYLKEIGKVSLISGETEVFLAKRIEKGEKIIEETILSSSILRATFQKLMPKIRSKKIKVYEIAHVDKLYALN